MINESKKYTISILLSIILSLVFVSIGVIDLILLEDSTSSSSFNSVFVNGIADWFSITLIVLGTIMFLVSFSLMLIILYNNFKRKKFKNNL